MTIQEIKERYARDPRNEQLASVLGQEQEARVRLKGLCGSAPAMVAAAASEAVSVLHLFVLSDKEEAAYFFNDLQSLGLEGRAFFYPASGRHPYQEGKKDKANALMRAEVLDAITKRKTPPLIISYPEALAEKVVTRHHLRQNTLEINTGDSLSIDFVNELLFAYEFERVDFVTQPGQFAIRGGIIDIFSFANELPYRVELFGDDVDSIRTFDPATQLSVTSMGKISILPNIQDKVLRESRQSFLAFIPENAAIWCRNYQLTIDKLGLEMQRAEAAYTELPGEVEHLAPDELYVSGSQFEGELTAFNLVEFGTQFHFREGDQLTYEQIPQPFFHKNFELLCQNLQENTSKGITNVILARNARQIERLYNIFEDIGQDVTFTSLAVDVREGFLDHAQKLAFYTDHQIFERFHRFRLKEGFKDAQKAITLKELTDLQPGDFVTHIDHGVGRFAGLKKIEVNDKMQEAIKLIYKDNDVLFVSIHSLHRISKYSGKEGTVPSINKLGSKAWQNLKQKTKKKVKEIAFDLIKLYAERKGRKGFAFAPDTYLQHELEASFFFEDTPDQVTTTQAVKKDMEQSAPMDRLICGDVGFGKTEIAIRAAFKAVTDSKQVAILAPTTILTLQHFKTFRKRLSEFPVSIDYINRFKSAAQQRESLKKLAAGETDIIIGTHRLVSKDVKFKELGLMIIDEEQKFGVSVKDKLKTLRTHVDSLTLTATPIPRTLQFSLMGARDLSIINTAPPNRQPVETELRPFSESVIQEAIEYELARDGQVFFVHNRVQNIGEVADMVRRLCPNARVSVGHGQMEGPQLERVMLDFIEGDTDVLVATTIIESGLDIPNANTIIIGQAQMFGLSDLHQMRGRVGRSNRKAFCYLLAPPLSALTSEARQRLQAIEQFSELGSGFNIAMRDLDIRGAGNLLGAEQSGFISEIGFDMYHKILDEAMEELKQTEFRNLFEQEAQQVFVKECQIETDLEIMLPDDYVNNITERMSLYRNLSAVEDERALEAWTHHLEDRFGPVPKETQRLIDTLRLRWVARDLGFEKVVLKNRKLIGYFISNQESPYFESATFALVLEYVKQHIRAVEMKERKEKLTLSFSDVPDIPTAISLLQSITQSRPNQATTAN